MFISADSKETHVMQVRSTHNLISKLDTFSQRVQTVSTPMTTFRSNNKNIQMGSRSKPISANEQHKQHGSAVATDQLYCNDKENQ